MPIFMKYFCCDSDRINSTNKRTITTYEPNQALPLLLVVQRPGSNTITKRTNIWSTKHVAKDNCACYVFDIKACPIGISEGGIEKFSMQDNSFLSFGGKLFFKPWFTLFPFVGYTTNEIKYLREHLWSKSMQIHR